MSSTSRTARSLMNAKVNLGFYLLVLVLTFFSRKIFLDCLGKDFLGLTGVLGNILGMLNLAELGIGTAVSFALYKPLYDGDKGRVIDVVGLFGYFYKWVGSFVAIAAVTVSFFLPSMLENEGVPLLVAYVAFYSFLISSLLSYFVNYKQIVFSADQRQYLISIYSQSANFAKLIIQMSVAYFYANYYAWILIELSFGILYCIVLQCKLKHHYPWLKNSSIPGKELVKENPDILKRTRQVFIHKLKDFLLTQCDQIFVFAYVSLGMVALYGNYVMLISRLSSLFSVTMDSIAASIGNLVAEGNKVRILSVFWEMHALRFFIGGLLAFGTYSFTDDFICLWLGPEYVLDSSVLLLLCANLYIMFVRGPVDMFNSAYGQFADTWSAWTEGAINLGLVLILGPIWGICGILIGKVVSVLFLVFIWKPCYLFVWGIKSSLWAYWVTTGKLMLVSALSWSGADWVLSAWLESSIFTCDTWLGWIITAFLGSILYCIVAGMLTFIVSVGFRSVLVRGFSILKKRFV